MRITPTALAAEVQAFDLRHPGVVAAAEIRHGLPKHLLHAVGSRETNLSAYYETHPGDGGHGRGTFQLDDRSHTIPSPFPVTTQADVAASMLHNLIQTFSGNLKSACSAYNAGVTGARNGIAQGDSDLFTTGHDYGADVVARMRSLSLPAPTPTPVPAPAPAPTMPTLREGSSGTAVLTLQISLHITVEFGPMTKAAVVRFQQQHGLVADGVVGPLTWRALGH